MAKKITAPVRVLGVDPGLRVTGYAVLEFQKQPRSGFEIKVVEAGVIRTKADSGIAVRLEKVYSGLESAIDDLKPHALVIEKLYAHYKHPATAILMGHVRGVVCLLSGTKNIPLMSLAATHVKKAVTGKGHASKEQVARMVQHYLCLKTMPSPPDVADAMAIALSYAFNAKNDK